MQQGGRQASTSELSGCDTGWLDLSEVRERLERPAGGQPVISHGEDRSTRGFKDRRSGGPMKVDAAGSPAILYRNY